MLKVYVVKFYLRRRYTRDKKTFQSKANRQLGERCMGYIANKFKNRSRGSPSENVQEVPTWDSNMSGGDGALVNKFELDWGFPCDL